MYQNQFLDDEGALHRQHLGTSARLRPIRQRLKLSLSIFSVGHVELPNKRKDKYKRVQAGEQVVNAGSA